MFLITIDSPSTALMLTMHYYHYCPIWFAMKMDRWIREGNVKKHQYSRSTNRQKYHKRCYNWNLMHVTRLLPNRGSFCGDGKTYNDEYRYGDWLKGWHGKLMPQRCNHIKLRVWFIAIYWVFGKYWAEFIGFFFNYIQCYPMRRSPFFIISSFKLI